jgi:hypothetical protein
MAWGHFEKVVAATALTSCMSPLKPARRQPMEPMGRFMRTVWLPTASPLAYSVTVLRVATNARCVHTPGGACTGGERGSGGKGECEHGCRHRKLPHTHTPRWTASPHKPHTTMRPPSQSTRRGACDTRRQPAAVPRTRRAGRRRAGTGPCETAAGGRPWQRRPLHRHCPRGSQRADPPTGGCGRWRGRGRGRGKYNGGRGGGNPAGDVVRGYKRGRTTHTDYTKR